MPAFDIDWSLFVLTEFVESLKDSGNTDLSCLDIGSGDGIHTNILRSVGCRVTQLDKYRPEADIREGFLEHEFSEQFDVVFCSHVIEHQRNCGLFLDKIYDVLKDDGILILSVPKHAATTMIEGHINCFIMPLLLQQLVYAGFDCKNGKVMSCAGIENSVIVPKAGNFDVSERGHDAYSWSDAHRERSFVPLQNQDFANDAAWFHNCTLWKVDGQQIQANPRQDKSFGVTVKSERFGVTIEV